MLSSMLFLKSLEVRGNETMKDTIMHLLSDAAQSQKVAATVSTVTTGSGVATFMGWIESDIGNFATITGIVLSIVLIITHIVKAFRDWKKDSMEMEIMKRTLEGSRKRHGIKERQDD